MQFTVYDLVSDVRIRVNLGHNYFLGDESYYK